MQTTLHKIIARGELKPFKDNFYLWKYVPSLAAAIIFLLLFLALSIAHTWKMYSKRAWFCFPFVIGGFLEVIGYGGRAGASNSTDNLLPYILQSIFLLVPPSLFAASIYMTLGRIITGLGTNAESMSLIKVRKLTSFFVCGDVFAFLIQATGAGIAAMGTMAELSEYIVIAGLVLQILFFGFFMSCSVIFHLRYKAYSSCAAIVQNFDWQCMMKTLYWTSVLILARCVFRVIEYAAGVDSYLFSTEWPLYIFDSLLMGITMGIFFWWYPSNVLVSGKIQWEDTVTLQNLE
ncbi:RTA1 like protein-domain-containing protein [Xylaria cf. heliscus]|nr:RTA1 like protein-domain-containing protein [Xylaria cf. heliscus]